MAQKNDRMVPEKAKNFILSNALDSLLRGCYYGYINFMVN